MFPERENKRIQCQRFKKLRLNLELQSVVYSFEKNDCTAKMQHVKHHF